MQRDKLLRFSAVHEQTSSVVLIWTSVLPARELFGNNIFTHSRILIRYIYKINDIIIVYHQPLQDIFQWSSQYLNTVLEGFFLTKGAFEEVIFFFFFFSQKITLHYAILFPIYYFLRGHKQYHGKWSKQIVRHQAEKNTKHAIVMIIHPQVSAKAFSVNIFQYEDVTFTQEGL